MDEEWAEFGAKASDLIEEGLEKRAAVMKLRSVGDGLGEFDGEAEVGGRGRSPALPGFAHVGTIEAGVDLYAEKAVSVALEVGEFCVSGWRKGVGVVARKCPAGGADVDVIEQGRVWRN